MLYASKDFINVYVPLCKMMKTLPQALDVKLGLSLTPAA